MRIASGTTREASPEELLSRNVPSPKEHSLTTCDRVGSSSEGAPSRDT
jgi:hypothetical protein